MRFRAARSGLRNASVPRMGSERVPPQPEGGEMAKVPDVGDQAPDFTLPSSQGDVSLARLLGKGAVLLVFYPGDDTPVCTKQLNAYNDGLDRFADVGAQVLAISPQSVTSHEGFACAQGGFGFPLLADEDKTVGAAYGIIGPTGFYRRSTFVVDPQGVIRYAHRSVGSMTFKPTEELVAAVTAAKSHA
jgi:peroxiredoxin Q/BCP